MLGHSNQKLSELEIPNTGGTYLSKKSDCPMHYETGQLEKMIDQKMNQADMDLVRADSFIM